MPGKNAHVEAEKGPYDLTPESLNWLADAIRDDGNYNETRLADTVEALSIELMHKRALLGDAEMTHAIVKADNARLRALLGPIADGPSPSPSGDSHE